MPVKKAPTRKKPKAEPKKPVVPPAAPDDKSEPMFLPGENNVQALVGTFSGRVIIPTKDKATLLSLVLTGIEERILDQIAAVALRWHVEDLPDGTTLIDAKLSALVPKELAEAKGPDGKPSLTVN